MRPLFQKTLRSVLDGSFINLERVGLGEKSHRLLASKVGLFFREAFSGLVHKLDPIFTFRERERDREKGKKRVVSLRVEDTRLLPHSGYDIGEPCIISWPQYL